MEILLLSLILVALLISMLCRSLVHRLLHAYTETKNKIEKIFNTSISDQWWNPKISHINKYKIKWTVKTFFKIIKFPIPVQFSDAFHTFNTIELGGYTYSITAPTSIYFSNLFDISLWISFFALFILIGLFFIIVFFNLGYDEIWRK